MENIDKIENTENTEIQPSIGEFTVNKKLLEFITIKGNIKYHTHEALVNAGAFSDKYKDINLMLTICKDGNVNFDELETNQISNDEKHRFLEMLCEKSIIPLRTSQFALNIVFRPTKNAQEKDVQLFLVVDHTKPYDKLLSIFDETPAVSDSHLSKLDELFGDLDITSDEEVEVKNELIEEEVVIEENDQAKNEYLSKLNEQFENAKKQKEEELINRLDRQKQELVKYKRDKIYTESKIQEVENEIELLNSRIESIKPGFGLNGWLFYLSTGEQGVSELDTTFEEMITKRFNKKLAEYVLNIIKGTTYTIKIAKKDDWEAEVSEDIINILSKIEGISLGEQPKELKYCGVLEWHAILEKMLKLGFEQDPEFDKYCGSNSYGSGVNQNDDQPLIEE